jgi:hypothetical protein
MNGSSRNPVLFRFDPIVTSQNAPPIAKLASPTTFLPHSKGPTPPNNCETSIVLFLCKRWLKKRPNNTRLRDFSSVLNRLDNVDRSLVRLSQQVESLTANCTLAAVPLPLPATKDQNGPEVDRKERPLVDVTSNQIPLNEGYSERLYSYPAVLCLFRASQKLLGAALNAKPPSPRSPLAESLANAALRLSLCKGGLLYRVGPVNWVRRRRCEGSGRLETRLNLEDLVGHLRIAELTIIGSSSARILY